MILLLSLLASCASTKSANVNITASVAQVRPDSKLIELCKLPVDIGDKALSAGQTEHFWTTDRKELVGCYNKHKALIDFELKRLDLSAKGK